MTVVIREYAFDNEEMILLLRHHFGSDKHFREHRQHFYRHPQKIYFVATQGDTVCGYCTLLQNEIRDLTVLEPYRGKGIAQSMIRHIQGRLNIRSLRIGTDNDALRHIVEKLGFKYTLNRGRYSYYVWQKIEEAN